MKLLDEIIKDIESKALECPFCGNKPVVDISVKSFCGLTKYRVEIGCNNIYCHVHTKTGFTDTYFDTAVKQSLKHWNDRFEKSDGKNKLKFISCYNCRKAKFDADGCTCLIKNSIVHVNAISDCNYYEAINTFGG